MNTIRLAKYESPAGTLLLGSYAEALCMCDWCIGMRSENTLRRLSTQLCAKPVSYAASKILEQAATELDEYFRGVRVRFETPLMFSGTPFRQKVMEQLHSIPYGETISYSELSCRLGRPRAVRATASAVAANPLSLFVPCHRVIASSGALAGYAGGLDAKKCLLQMEHRNYI